MYIRVSVEKEKLHVGPYSRVKQFEFISVLACEILCFSK